MYRGRCFEDVASSDALILKRCIFVLHSGAASHQQAASWEQASPLTSSPVQCAIAAWLSDFTDGEDAGRYYSSASLTQKKKEERNISQSKLLT